MSRGWQGRAGAGAACLCASRRSSAARWGCRCLPHLPACLPPCPPSLPCLPASLPSLTALPACLPARLPAPPRRSNPDVVDICKRLSSQPCDAIAAELAKQAVAQGSTDDVTVLVLKLK